MSPAWRLPVLAAVAVAAAGGLQSARPYPPHAAGPPPSSTSLALRWAPTECVPAACGGLWRIPARIAPLTIRAQFNSLPPSYRVVGYDVEAKTTARGAGWEVVRRLCPRGRHTSPPSAVWEH